MAAGATVVQYNGVLFNNVLTRSYRQEPVFDQSGQSVIYHRHTIRIVGYVHAEYQATSPTVYTTPYDTRGAAYSHRKIRHRLMKVRKPFLMTSGTDVLLRCNPASMASPVPPPSGTNITDIDVNNGPKCTVVDVTQITGNEVYRIEAEFEICKIECDDNGYVSNTSLVLSNVWSCSDDIDRNFMTRRTITGTLRTATSLVNPHSFRNFVMPPLENGMRRESMQFVATEDGLNLQYTIVDQEVAFSPPKPATTWSMRHSESVTRQGAVGSFVSVEVTLGGDRNADWAQLISLAAAIIDAKVTGTGVAGREGRIINSFEIVSEVGDDSNLIHASCTAQRTPADKDDPTALALLQVRRIRPITNDDLENALGAMRAGAITGGYDYALSRGSRAGESLESHGPIDLTAAFSVYLQDACSGDHEIYKTPKTTDPGKPTEGQKSSIEAYISEGTLASDDSSSWVTEEGRSNVYTMFQIDSAYEINAMRAHMPVAGGTIPPSHSLGSSSGATSVVITLGPKMVKRRIRMAGERVGKPPTFPMPRDTFEEGGVNYTLVDASINVGVPERDSEGRQVYRENREYVYAADRDPFVEGQSTALKIGENPNDVAGVYRRVFDAQEWSAEV